MQHSLLAALFLVAFASISTIQAYPVLSRNTTRPAYCPGVTANNTDYILCLAASTGFGGSVTLPVNLTYEDWETTKRRVLEAHTERNVIKSCEGKDPLQPSDSSQRMCSLTYLCDYDAGRFPQYILHASCGLEQVNYRIANSEGMRRTYGRCQCKPILRPLTVLRFVGCEPYEQWRMEQQVVSVGCSCDTSPWTH